jgi:ribosomal protein S18 acetylase RimI-like enzyme
MDKRELYRQVAELHIASINQGFLATLGVGVVSRMYRAIDEAPESILIVEVREGHVVGFISGGIGMGHIYKRMLRHPIGLTIALLPSVLRPRRMLRIFELLRYSRRGGRATGLPAAELLSMAVSPEYRGRHIAEHLYVQLVHQFKARGVREFRIIVGAALAQAHRFYQKMGAVPNARIEVHDGESSCAYVHQVD